MTDSERKKIIDLYESGLPATQIRQLMAMTTADFNKAITELKRNGDLPKRKTTMEKVAEAYSRGERNPYEICETYGISYGTLRVYKAQMGIKSGRQKRNFRHCDRTNAITADLQLGTMTVAEIARKHGVCWQYVKDLKNKLEEDENG